MRDCWNAYLYCIVLYSSLSLFCLVRPIIFFSFALSNEGYLFFLIVIACEKKGLKQRNFQRFFSSIYDRVIAQKRLKNSCRFFIPDEEKKGEGMPFRHPLLNLAGNSSSVKLLPAPTLASYATSFSFSHPRVTLSPSLFTPSNPNPSPNI